MGAYISFTYYSGEEEIGIMYIMLDENLMATDDVSFTYNNGKEINGYAVIRLAQNAYN